LKYDAHLRAQGKCEDLFHQTVRCDINTPDGAALSGHLWNDFGDIVREINGERAALSNRQALKYENKARNELGNVEMQRVAIILPTPTPPWTELPPLQVGYLENQ
jgi:hypothetical protein